MRLTGRDLTHLTCALRAKATRDTELAVGCCPTEGHPEPVRRLVAELLTQAQRQNQLADLLETASAVVIEYTAAG